MSGRRCRAVVRLAMVGVVVGARRNPRAARLRNRAVFEPKKVRVQNVIMGRLIPAGTGLPAYKRLQVVLDEKSPTYALPTFVRVTPAELVAVGDE